MKIFIVYEEYYVKDSWDDPVKVVNMIKAFENEEEAYAFANTNVDYDVEEVEYVPHHNLKS